MFRLLNASHVFFTSVVLPTHATQFNTTDGIREITITYRLPLIVEHFTHKCLVAVLPFSDLRCGLGDMKGMRTVKISHQQSPWFFFGRQCVLWDTA